MLSAGGRARRRGARRGRRPGAARAARGAARGGREPHRRARRRPLHAAPRAAARGRARRPAARASAPSCTARSRARSRPRGRAASPAPSAPRAIAHHYLAAGDQPAALAAAVRAGVAAMDVQAYREGATLFERALELWDRVPDAAGAGRRPTRSSCSSARPPATSTPTTSQRSVTLAKRALALIDEAAEPRRARMALRAAAARAVGAAAPGGGGRGARARARAARRRRAEPRARRAARAPGEDA